MDLGGTFNLAYDRDIHSSIPCCFSGLRSLLPASETIDKVSDALIAPSLCWLPNPSILMILSKKSVIWLRFNELCSVSSGLMFGTILYPSTALCLLCSESSVFDRDRIEGKFEAKKELRRTGSQSYEKVRLRVVWLWETWVEFARGEAVGVISRGDDECWTLALKMPNPLGPVRPVEWRLVLSPFVSLTGADRWGFTKGWKTLRADIVFEIFEIQVKAIIRSIKGFGPC